MPRETNESASPIDWEIISNVKRICRDYGITAAHYFDLSNMNSGEIHDRPMSYAMFCRVMSGYVVNPDHADLLDASTRIVRDALNKQKVPKLAKQLIDQLRAVLYAYDNDPDVISRQDLSALRRILRRASKRIT